ncbi:hypothetical protein [Nocardioides zeae]|uniref:Uncharacterized protein n=1 Tax=Nocardioides zeae TaxID=1457234 RepID=A0AAJ1U8I3_9ACTN|nr:hypothetical protein [Nocardioides zeae]MDQ1106331.1 hypothetical protein [Nocardioides zeae]
MTPILLQAVVWIVLPLSSARQDRRYQGEAGRERLLALAPGDAWAETVAHRRSWYLVMLLVMAVFATLGGVAAVIAGEPLVAPVALAVALSCAYAARSNHRTATHVLAVLAERGAEVRPTPEERSALRRRRTRQLLVAAGVLYAAATATVALVGAGWARAWRYGDELPATD